MLDFGITGTTCGIGILIVLIVLSVVALIPNPPRQADCVKIEIVSVWSGPYGGDSGNGALIVKQLHAVVLEVPRAIMDGERTIPLWPGAMLCFLPPQDSL